MSDPSTVTHGGVTYTIVALDGCLDLAMGLHRQGKPWHSHVLSPGCEHNPYADGYAIVVEDDSERRAYIARSEGFPEVDKDLVKILHGDDILDASKTASAGGSGKAVASPMLERLREIDARRIAWHHHMNFPTCAFNPQPGKWAITIESGEGSFFEAYDGEPIDVLREVEVLYFNNLEGRR
ncbi:MAG: hypothetical protein WBG88_02910 [Mesorhizobium sp.]